MRGNIIPAYGGSSAAGCHTKARKISPDRLFLFFKPEPYEASQDLFIRFAERVVLYLVEA